MFEGLKGPASVGYGAASLGPGHGAGKTRSGCTDPIIVESASGVWLQGMRSRSQFEAAWKEVRDSKVERVK